VHGDGVKSMESHRAMDRVVTSAVVYFSDARKLAAIVVDGVCPSLGE